MTTTTASLPYWDVYCGNTTAVNALVFNLPNGLRVWYSYKTPVAFLPPGLGTGSVIVRENDWAQTTGKHINAIDGGSREAKKARICGADFEQRLAEALRS